MFSQVIKKNKKLSHSVFSIMLIKYFYIILDDKKIWHDKNIFWFNYTASLEDITVFFCKC